jgi:hypothetical protein
MLVWNEMLSITAMMSTILRELRSIRSMVEVAFSATCAPSRATVVARAASWLASRQLSAFSLTVDESSSIAAAVSSSVEACSSVRSERSTLPTASASAASRAAIALACALVTRVRRFSCASMSVSKSFENWPAPSRRRTSSRDRIAAFTRRSRSFSSAAALRTTFQASSEA